MIFKKWRIKNVRFLLYVVYQSLFYSKIFYKNEQDIPTNKTKSSEILRHDSS